MNQNISLRFNNGKSDKVYCAEIIQDDDDLHFVNFSYGRFGSTLRTGTKTQSPVCYKKALSIYEKLVKSKISKGYTQEGDGSKYSFVEPESTGIGCQLLNPITEAEMTLKVSDIKKQWWMQEKFDGQRKLVKIKNGETLVINKLGNSTSISKNILDELINLGEDILIDGEDLGGTYMVFDLLEFRGVDIRSMPYNERMFRLMALNLSAKYVNVVETARSASQMCEMIKNLREKNAEGLVMKKWNAPFEQGRPASGGNQVKYKFYDTTSVVVSKVNDKRSVGISILDGKNELFIGNVTIPPNKEIPNIGDIIEVRYLYAYKGGSLYQPTYLNKRNDVLKSECQICQLKYKRDLVA